MSDTPFNLTGRDVFIVIVTGSRKWTDRRAVFDALDELAPETVVHGGALGADTMAHQWAKKRGKEARVYFPDWDGHGKGAALHRNQDMLVRYPGARLLAFPVPDSRGTLHTMREAEKMGMTVINRGSADGR